MTTTRAVRDLDTPAYYQVTRNAATGRYGVWNPETGRFYVDNVIRVEAIALAKWAPTTGPVREDYWALANA
jgi:hypothetical protein